MQRFTAHSLEEMQKIAGDFAVKLSPKKDGATVVGLSGDLGAGKTSFAQGVARSLGVVDNVVSPTFVIEKIYEIVASSKKQVASNGETKNPSLDSNNLLLANFKHLIHIDAYRLEKSQELLHLGWQEIISDSGNLILVEWPERVADVMPEHIRVNFTHLSENVREVEVI